MNYPNLESVEKIFKDYILDSLKERERIEKALIYSIEDIFIQSARRIISQLLQEHGVKSIKNEKEVAMKPLSATLNDFIDREAKIVNDELYSTIQQSIFSSVCTALSPMARIRLDYLLDQQSKVGSETYVPNKNIKSTGSPHALFSENNQQQAIEGDKEVGNGFIYILGIGYLNTYADEDEDDSHHRYRLIGEFKNPSYYLPKMKSIQKDIIAQADAIAKSSMQKVRHFREKEFKMSDRIWDVAEKNKNMMKRLIEENVNKDVTKCAKAIDALVTKGKSTACREYPNMMRRLDGRIPGYVSFEAYRFARNEIAEITFRATIEDFKDNPFVAGVKWLLANNRLKQYEDKCCCNDLAYQDSFGLGHGVYPVDQVPDRPHVMCLCTVAPISSRRLKKAIEGGMQLGNVPPKEWLESLEEEKNKATIKDATNQYALTLFQNEDENTLKKECIEAIKGHEWFNDCVKDVDKATFIEDLEKLTKEGLFLLARHTGAMQAELYCEGESRYNIKENKVYTNLHTTPITHGADKAIGFKIGMRAFLHETGHWLDSNLLGVKNGIRDKLPELDTKIKNDVLNVINKVGRQAVKKGYIKDFTDLKQLTQSSIKRTPQLVRDLIRELINQEKNINSSISDLYGGATNKQIQSGYGHEGAYWLERKSRLASEAVAHMTEALCSGSKRIKPMKKFLPDTWNYFIRNIKEVLK